MLTPPAFPALGLAVLCSSDHMTCMEGSGTVLNQDSSHGIVPLVLCLSLLFFSLVWDPDGNVHGTPGLAAMSMEAPLSDGWAGGWREPRLVMSSSLSEPSLRTSPVPATSHLFKTGSFPALENHPYTPDRRSNRKNRGVFTLCSHGLLPPSRGLP